MSTEQKPTEIKLRSQGLEVVHRLQEVANNHQRHFSPSIEAVLVLSGPGTYYEPLKEGQRAEVRWMDRDRIRAGVGVVREVTAACLRKEAGHELINQFNAGKVTREDIVEHGPYLIYNGTPDENNVFRTALTSDFSKMPEAKTVIINDVYEEGNTSHPIRHTGDQVKSLFQAIENPHSLLFGVQNVGIVQHISDFARTMNYFEKYNNEYRKKHEGKEVKFWVFGIRNRPGTEEYLVEEELKRLEPYYEKGDLAGKPAEFNT